MVDQDKARQGWGRWRRAAALPWLVAPLGLGLGQAVAAPLPAGELEQRCWLGQTRERTRANLRETTSVDFANLRSGYAVRSPFAVDFAVRGLGVAPAGVKLDNTGHHHLLVDRPMPNSAYDPIPFDDSYRHYGKGQTGTLLDLPPGRHTLRLLFADYAHRPHFVFSREIEVTVRGPRASTPRPQIDAARFAETCAAWYADEMTQPPPADEPLRIVNVRAGEALSSPFTLRLGVSGFGIAAAGAKVEQAGFFVLELLEARTRQVASSFKLSNGATQVNAFLGMGDYIARLRLVDPTGTELLPAHELPFKVTRQEAF